MISYSAKAAKALSFLKRPYNDIDIYVEDTANPNMWLHIFESILPNGVRLTSVNMLGGRDRVMAACRLDQSDDGRKKLYVIDGDYDFLLGKRKPRLRHLYRVPAYCIENMLLKPDAVVEAAFSCTINMNRGGIGGHLDLVNLVGRNEPLIKALWVMNAVAEHLGAGLPTSSYSVHQLVRKVAGRVELDEEQVRKRIIDLASGISMVQGRQKFVSAYSEVAARARNLSINQVASGKDFLLPLIWLRLHGIKDFTVSMEHFKVHLAKRFNAKSDPMLARRLQAICV